MTGELRCQSCGSGDVDPFYRVDAIPVHSVLLMPTREVATGYPKRDLQLGFCSTCGFIQNVVFDPGVHEYSTSCEETQGFSPTFNAFARKLAARWIDRYDLRHKRVLEIGCGKGEFLALLCEMGPNQGIGLDPAYVPERLDSEAADRIEFVQDFYSEKYSHLAADFVCCRHTLEHIQPTLDFMRIVRQAIGDRAETVVAFELPDVERVLREQAFWDIYYEHCSYFSLGSLGRLFRASGFEVLELERDYDDQYLVVEARPVSGSGSTRHPAEESVEQLAHEVEQFRERVPARRRQWRDRLRRNHAEGRRAAIWGSGSKAVAFLTTLGIGEEVGCVTDINPYRHDKFVPGTGHRIVPPAELKEFRPDLVIAMNPIYVDEIRADLRKMGLEPELAAV